MGELASLHMWRRRYQEVRPEAFTDRPSRRARDVRMAWATGIVGALALLGALTRVILGVADIGTSAEDWPLEAAVLALIGIPLIVVTVALARRRDTYAADR